MIITQLRTSPRNFFFFPSLGFLGEAKLRHYGGVAAICRVSFTCSSDSIRSPLKKATKAEQKRGRMCSGEQITQLLPITIASQCFHTRKTMWKRLLQVLLSPFSTQPMEVMRIPCLHVFPILSAVLMLCCRYCCAVFTPRCFAERRTPEQHPSWDCESTVVTMLVTLLMYILVMLWERSLCGW